jgi:hypothetical protein
MNGFRQYCIDLGDVIANCTVGIDFAVLLKTLFKGHCELIGGRFTVKKAEPHFLATSAGPCGQAMFQLKLLYIKCKYNMKRS